MTTLSRRWLFWTPRVLCIAFLLFLSLFALDVFDEGHGFWRTPVFILAGALALAWRWEWIGTVIFTGAGFLYVWFALSRPWPAAMKAESILLIAGPAWAIGALFLANWLKRRELHPRG